MHPLEQRMLIYWHIRYFCDNEQRMKDRILFLDTGVNISIGKQAPQDYFTAALNQCATKELKVGTITENAALRENLAVNCIPADIFTMTAADYEKFLKERRILMAKKIKKYYNSL